MKMTHLRNSGNVYILFCLASHENLARDQTDLRSWGTNKQTNKQINKQINKHVRIMASKSKIREMEGKLLCL